MEQRVPRGSFCSKPFFFHLAREDDCISKQATEYLCITVCQKPPRATPTSCSRLPTNRSPPLTSFILTRRRNDPRCEGGNGGTTRQTPWFIWNGRNETSFITLTRVLKLRRRNTDFCDQSDSGGIPTSLITFSYFLVANNQFFSHCQYSY